ncbi:related to ATP-binding cassette transporter protein YOR1 [Cephalotrichum gorgonifer]|uniref:Related to ATP-binding cassette transporter protein YOR1 n=1 Tax=Cephalotrichum gorgonifer TaxID=2041049 RepID=A0AAE8MV41_9PEZI|nr:related to ATP-binding cassette transporter protein YOR1 [Cephalotrichum gorgonifer]
MVELDEKPEKASDPQSESAQPAAITKEEDLDRIDDVEKEALKAGAESAARDPALKLTKSHATDASATTQATAPPSVKQPEKRWYRKLNPLRWGSIPPVPTEKRPSPENTASFLSLLTFSWMGPLMTTGYKRPLERNDLWTVNPARAAEPMTEKLRESFKTRSERGDKYPLLWAIFETFRFEIWIGAVGAFFSQIFMVLAPFTLRFLIQFATDAYVANMIGGSAPSIGKGVGFVLGITAMQVCQSMSTNHFIYRGMIVGAEVRAVLIGLIFEKSMVLSGRAKAGGAEDSPDVPGGLDDAGAPKASKKASKEKKGGGKGGSDVAGDGTGWGNGRVVNLMSVDTYRIDQASALFHMIWSAPVSLLLTITVLIINLTYSALAGCALLVVSLPLLMRAIRGLFARRRRVNKITDQRVGLTQEILQSVRFVKYFGWESAFLGRLREIRDREILGIQFILSIRNAINAISLSLPVFAAMLSFITYSLTDHDLRAANIFSSLALFNSMRLPLNMLPLVLGQVVDAWSSMKRIQEFLTAEETVEDVIYEPDGDNALEMRHASFTWERTPTQDPEATVKGKSTTKQAESGVEKQRASSGDETEGSSTTVAEREPFKLRDLDFSVKRDELVAVIGTVGSGKTSLLAALAGDMRKTDGEVILGASRAFCPQSAWVQNTTVRENILFGKEMDKEWYQEVIRACSLQQDLDMLPNGDMTEIGERGITISGGQKQRLNIARAIYFNADIVLMDDPLSAVDAHVGRHIFDQAISGLLKGKCRILATHQLWVLHRCDRIIWMEEGSIRAVDTFENLMSDHVGFQNLMESTGVEKKGDEDGKGPGAGDGQPDEGGKKKKRKGATLMQAEERALASVPWSVYKAYIKASGTMWNVPIVIFALVLSQAVNIVSGLWLSWWTSGKFKLTNAQYIGGYAGLGVLQVVLMFLFSVLLTILGTTASKRMLHDAVTRVLRAPMSFFDTTPLGRITNRFSRDVDVMDNNLTDAIRMYFFTLAMMIAVFCLIIAYFPYFAIALVPLSVLFVFAAAYYRASAREVKRFESVLRSTVFAKFGEGLSGIASIRAYGLQKHFIGELRSSIDEMDAAYFLTFSNQRWLSLRLDLIGNAMVFVTGMLVVTSRFDVSPSISGLVLSYLLSIVMMLQFFIRQLAEVENAMNAVERLRYYGNNLEEEAPLKTIEVRKSWPEKGEITFENVQMRYRDGLPLVLQNLNIHIRGGERVGIVGRTGAGKSSIMSTLFRLVELSGGHILIDGLDISTIGLQDLRSRLAIIPQDPTLFKGTVRSNLDPFSEHTDLELWSALRQAGLVAPQQQPQGEHPNGSTSQDATPSRDQTSTHLDSVVEEDGLNFSLGQRQLMALARALVRGSQIIVCDEATSSVDMETDEKIQTTIATGFRGKTLLCIAHRLRTIVGYDRICVMDAGSIAELGTPVELWELGGVFKGMCERSGIRLEDIRSAREALEGL